MERAAGIEPASSAWKDVTLVKSKSWLNNKILTK